MAGDIEAIKPIVIEYANAVRQVLPVDKVVLYGSYAKGNATELSDVDICFFITNLTDDNWLEIMIQLRMISLNYKLFFSPMVYHVSDLYDDNPFINGVISTGIEIQ
ncbi:MAG: nucleotidyltransferase domain-containing protein [Deltaproteobacteria bacterium]|jgi:predicted nucleotidyltransferase|nr:nucleotidyltransferase domain-containing protein [Deltaproteobacteria bacterium]